MKQVAAMGIKHPRERSAMPDDVLIFRLKYMERHGQDEAGRWYIVGGAHHPDGTPILPCGFDVKKQLMLCNVIDRGSQGNSGTMFCMGPIQIVGTMTSM